MRLSESVSAETLKHAAAAVAAHTNNSHSNLSTPVFPPFSYDTAAGLSQNPDCTYTTDGAIISCVNGINMTGDDIVDDAVKDDWMIVVDVIYFYALPSIVLLGILLQFVNIVVLARQVRASIDCYILGLVVATLLLLLCAVLQYLPIYIGDWDIFGYMYGYVISCRDWFWYTTIWVTVIMSLERCLSISGSRPRALCTSLQAGITVLMTYLVCLVSALPRFWEYEPVMKFDPQTNFTTIVSEKSLSTDTPEYNVMYFWYVTTITIFLPHPIMFILSIFLHRSNCKSTASKRSLSKKHNTGQVLNHKVTEEIKLTRLLIALITIYILLTSPYIVLNLLYKVLPETIIKTAVLYIALEKIFTVLFYFNYILHFPILLTFDWGYRTACCGTCCCCCTSPYQLAAQTNNYEY